MKGFHETGYVIGELRRFSLNYQRVVVKNRPIEIHDIARSLSSSLGEPPKVLVAAIAGRIDEENSGRHSLEDAEHEPFGERRLPLAGAPDDFDVFLRITTFDPLPANGNVAVELVEKGTQTLSASRIIARIFASYI